MKTTPKHNTGRSWRQRFKSALCGTLMGLVIPSLALGQTATLLPNAKQQYVDDSGNPVASGQVFYYVPPGTTKKTVWQDAAETTPAPNPVQLDAAGRPVPTGQTYGDGVYRQKVLDQNGVTIWDAVTSSTGTSGGSAPAFSEGVMVGAIIPWANMTLPGKYLYTAGQAVSRTTYAQLLTALTSQPTILCQSGSATIAVSTDISDKVPIGAPVEASCFAPATFVASKGSGTLTLTNNATTTASVSSIIFPWGEGNGSTTFNVPDLRGRVLAGRDNMNTIIAGVLSTVYYLRPSDGTGVNPDAVNAVGGSQSQTLIAAQIPSITSANTGIISATTAGSSAVPQNATISSSYAGGGISGYVPGTNSALVSTMAVGVIALTSNNTGTGGTGTAATPHTIVQPTVTSDYIIKALPDDTPGGPGVSSIGGMTGAITCGTNIMCNANTISVNITFPPPTAVTLGGVFSKTCSSSNWFSQLDTSGTFGCSQPSFADLTGTIGLAQISSNLITYAKIQQGTGLSVVGVAGNAGANNADIVASTDAQVLRRSGTSIGFGTLNLASSNAVGASILPLANGGTGQATASTARASSGLNVEQYTGHGDSIYTILSTDQTVGTNAVFTASRTWTLPAANSVNPGQGPIVADFAGTVTGVNTLVVQRAGADTINSGTAVTISAANGAYLFRSDGVSKWTAQSLGAASGGAVTSVSIQASTATISGTCTVTTSGTCPTVSQTTPGTWTPADASGAGLSFSSVSTSYNVIGNTVFAYATFTYPVTASGATAKISGLPVTAPNTGYGNASCSASTNDGAASAINAITQQATTNVTFTGVLNSVLTNATVHLSCVYPVS